MDCRTTNPAGADGNDMSDWPDDGDGGSSVGQTQVYVLPGQSMWLTQGIDIFQPPMGNYPSDYNAAQGACQVVAGS